MLKKPYNSKSKRIKLHELHVIFSCTPLLTKAIVTEAYYLFAVFIMNHSLHLKERVTTNEIKCKLAKMATAKFFSESHATANVSLLAH